MYETYVSFKAPEPPVPPSLSCRLGVTGNVIFIQNKTWFVAEDNQEEIIPVHVAAKRRYGVIEQDAPVRFGKAITVSYAV